MTIGSRDIFKKILNAAIKEDTNLNIYRDALACLRILEKNEYDLAHKYIKYITAVNEQAKPSYEQYSEFLQVRKDLYRFDVRENFETYLKYVEFERDPKKMFYLPRKKIMQPITKHLQDLEEGKIDLLSLSFPPGTGKTTLGIFYLTWIMGKYPDQPNLASAHSGMLTRGFYDGAMSIITDPEYLWQDVFPDAVGVVPNSKEETIDINKKHRFSTLTCRAINASLTGATRCEKILYCDDLCSGIEEAMNAERLESLWIKYLNDLKSRKKLGAKELHIATRWSVHDVIGRLQVQYGGDPKARFITIPALNEDGESNFDYDFGVGFDTAYFMDMKNNLDDASFKALYMNEPIEREGLLYHENELRRFFELPDIEPDATWAVCDTKDKGTDYACCWIAVQYGQDYYLVDVVCDNNKPEIVETKIENLLVKWNPQIAQFESNSAGGRIAKDIQANISKRGSRTKITTKYTTQNKETKIIVNSPFAKEHFLFRDASKYKPASDYGQAMKMLCNYTLAGKNKHDDVPDAISMLAEFVQKSVVSPVEIIKRPF